MILISFDMRRFTFDVDNILKVSMVFKCLLLAQSERCIKRFYSMGFMLRTGPFYCGREAVKSSSLDSHSHEKKYHGCWGIGLFKAN